MTDRERSSSHSSLTTIIAEDWTVPTSPVYQPAASPNDGVYHLSPSLDRVENDDTGFTDLNLFQEHNRQELKRRRNLEHRLSHLSSLMLEYLERSKDAVQIFVSTVLLQLLLAEISTSFSDKGLIDRASTLDREVERLEEESLKNYRRLKRKVGQ